MFGGNTKHLMVVDTTVPKETIKAKFFLKQNFELHSFLRSRADLFRRVCKIPHNVIKGFSTDFLPSDLIQSFN